jgi:hypothetical protein
MERSLSKESAPEIVKGVEKPMMPDAAEAVENEKNHE